MASWFTNALDKITPWDRGGEVQRRQEKKKQEQNQPKIVRPTPNPGITTNADRNMDVIKGQKKKSTSFGTLDMPNKVAVPTNNAITQKSGTVVKPTVRPKVEDTRAWGTKLFDTANPWDDGRSWAVPGKQSKPNFVQRNLSPTGVFNIGKEIVQGTTRLPIETAMTVVSPVKRIKAADKLREEGAKPGDPRFKEAMDKAGSYSWQPSGWQKRLFGDDKIQNFAETGKDIKGAIKDATGKDVNSAIPTAAIIALNMIPGGRKASKAALKSFENASMASKSLARDIPVQEAVDRGIKIPTRVVEGAPIQDVTPRLPGETPALAPTPKPTVRTPEPSPLIQDVSGGESFPTPDALVQYNIDQARREAADRFNSTDTGNMADVTPRKAPEPYKVPDNQVKAAQDKIIDDYAAMLKNIGEGNGVAINQATGARISNNFRFPGTGSKRLTKAQWRDMAEEQLRGGGAEPSIQKGFDDAANPEVQSLLKQGEQAPQELGKPIRVKEVKGIDVKQVTDVPTNMPEVPGTVRVTTKSDPVQAQTEAIAAQPVPVAPAPLPKVGTTLPDGTKVTKAMVKAARNQLKLAKQKAKVDAERQALIDGMPGRNTNTPVNSIEQTIQSNRDRAASKGYESTDLIGTDYNEGMTQKIISAEDFRTDKSVEGRTVIGGVFKAGKNSDEQLMLYRVDHTPESAAKRASQLEKQKEFMGELPSELQKELDSLQVPSRTGNPGHASTGIYRKGKNGNITESATRESDNAMGQSDISTLSAGDIIQRAQENITTTGTAGVRNVIDAKALRDSGRFPATSPEYKALNKIYNDHLSEAARTMGLADKAARGSASGDHIANRFINKLLLVSEDGSRMTEGHIAVVKQADNAFTEARDAANRALDRYNATKSEADWDTWKQARQTADEAEKHALITEYRVANDVLKGNKNPEALKAIEKAQQDAGVYQMDWIDANMLSGTGTPVRNYFNTSGIRLENSTIGRLAGGYSGKGAKIGNKLGNKSVISDFKARNELDQNILNKAVRQWSTTMNTLGEGNIKAVAYGRAYKHYENVLKKQGITGDQLERDVEVMLHTDPEKMVAHYEGIAMNENALSALAHSKKIEQQMADMIAGKGGNKAAQLAAKAAVRLTVGFPTVIARSLVGGMKRATLGVPERIHAAFVKNDPLKKADLIYSAKVHGGSGAMLYALGAGLAATGVITGAYPDDPAEREQWKRDGIQANSINIAGNWFSIPGYFGALALPLLVPAYVKDARSVNEIKNGITSAVMNMSPTDSMSKFFAGLEGRGGDAWGKNLATSAVRALTPAGALFNQLARMTDTTKNDTTTKSDIMNLLDSIAGGIPGVNNFVNRVDATDDQGNVLHNPAVWATALGASGQDQQAGIEDSQQIQTQANNTYASLKNVGVLDNANLMDLVDEKVRSQIERGQDLTPEQVTDIQKTITKGISTSLGPDSDSNWRENGDYATDLVAYQVKLQQLEADPRAKKSDIEGVKTQIARSKVLQDNKVPYETLKLYQTTSQTDWASMGRQYDKNGDANEDYDPDTYNILMNLDKLMTDAKGSYNESHPDKNKYDPKGAGSGYGSGGRKAPKMSTDFGTLSTSGNPMAPKVRQYETANMAGTSGIPVINVVRPNIIHRIGRG